MKEIRNTKIISVNISRFRQIASVKSKNIILFCRNLTLLRISPATASKQNTLGKRRDHDPAPCPDESKTVKPRNEIAKRERRPNRLRFMGFGKKRSRAAMSNSVRRIDTRGISRVEIYRPAKPGGSIRRRTTFPGGAPGRAEAFPLRRSGRAAPAPRKSPLLRRKARPPGSRPRSGR